MTELRKDGLVVVTITRVMPYGAIAKIEEHEGIEGFLHISEVSSKWIKNIGDYVKVGQKTVAKVIEYDPKKKVATISLRRVTEDDRKKILDLYNNIQKSRKVLHAALKQAKSRAKLEKVEEKILKDYENLYDFMLDVLEEGPEVAEEEGLSEKVSETLYQLVQKSFKPPVARIRRILRIEVFTPDGIDAIKKALRAVKNATVSYLGAPRYLLEITAEDYKKANKILASAEKAIAQHLPKKSNFSILEE